MPISKETRQARHEHADAPRTKRGQPHPKSGNVGDQSFTQVPGKGLVHFVKGEQGWKEMSSSTGDFSGRARGEQAAVIIGGAAAGGGTGAAVEASSHSDLSNLGNDDHPHYSHITNARTITADHAFTGQPTFSNIDINGGTINGITDLAVADGGTGQSTLDNLITLGNHTVGNYMVNTTGNSQVAVSHTQGEGSTSALSIVNDSIGDTQLTFNTGQHLTSTSSPQFSNMTLGEYSNPNYSNGEIGTSTFASGFVGTGWKMSKSGNEYNFETNNMLIRGTLSVYELLIQQVRATNGAIFVSSAAKVESASGLSASDDDGTITFEDPSDNNLCPFAANDLIMMQRVNPGSLVAKDAAGGATNVIKKLVYKVASVSGKTVTVENGGYNNTSFPSEGDDFVRIGNTNNSARQGIIYLTSDDSNSPYIDIKSDIDSYSDWTGSTPKVRLGKLDGITDSNAGLSGSQSELYGLYSDSVYLKGHVYASSGEIGGIKMASNKLYVGTGTYYNSNTAFYLDSGGDFSLKDKFKWDASASTLTLKGTFILENGDSVGAGITWRGTYNAGVAYAKNDSVVYQSSSYIALQSTTGNTPSPGSSYWDLLADQGSDGANGSNGSNGQNGQDGTNGSNGQDGATGQTGAQGATGATGAQGDTGAAGAAGAAGARGSRHYYYSVSGSSWSDSDANTAISNAGDTKVARDTVTLSKANTFSTTKYWDGDSWEAVTQVVDGNLIVHGTVGADQVDANDIFSVNITATNTITGGTLQTGSSGQRIVMDGSNNKMNFYNSSGTNLIQLDAGGSGYGAGMQIVSGGSISLSRDANAYPSNTTTTSHMSIYPNQLTVNTRSDYPASSGIYSAHIGDDNSTLRAGYFSCTNNSTGGNSRAYGLHVAEGMFVHDSAKWAWFGNHSREVGYGIDGGVLNVRGYTNSDPSAADGQAIRIWDAGSGVNRWSINIDSGDDLSFRYNATSDGGWISNTSNTGQITFTGQHRCKGNSGMTTADYAALEGYIVSASGSYDQMNGDDITISEALPVVALSSTDNDKKVFGVVSGREGEMRTYQAGQFNSSWGALSEEEERIMINSLGEGAMWVTNLNGNLENGDYVTSSTAAGLGQKQDDDLLHNYTVAKITQDCDFSSGTEFQHNGQTYKKQFVGCTYHCG